MRNIVGQPARAGDFFHRKREMRRIEKAIAAGENLQIASPRRIGKTSLLYYYYDNPPPNTHVVFVDTESISSVNDYYRKIYERILEHESISTNASIGKQIKDAGNAFLGKIKAANLGRFGLEFRDVEDLNYFEELLNFLNGIDLLGYRIILMVDEFPETIINIIEKNHGNTEEADDLLKTNRELRQDPDINPKLQMIYTGSVSLNLTVNRFGSSKYINDLRPISVSPLDYDEAVILINEVLGHEGYQINSSQIDYLIRRMDWCIVSQVQMVIEEITSQIDPDEAITEDIIEKAFLNLLNHEHKNYFNHYQSRLNRVYGKENLPFIDDVLNICGIEGYIHRNRIRDLAVKHGLLDRYHQLLEGLEYDGYINNTQQVELFVFNSPILRLWWKKYACHD